MSVTQVLPEKRATNVSVEVKRGSPGPLQYLHCQSTQLVGFASDKSCGDSRAGGILQLNSHQPALESDRKRHVSGIPNQVGMQWIA